ncbi:MAG TPA: alpha/beta hydrolase-fold protein [Bacteroidales bacterium]|nr:alpha/beta hydrolase-fold protein [Bacteroidales bacterium]
MKKIFFLLSLLAIALTACNTGKQTSKLTFSLHYADSLLLDSPDGRLLLFLATNENPEPRFQTGAGYHSQQVFGIEVTGWKAGENKVIGSEVFGYPVCDLADLPPGEYWVQALLHKYETFNLSTGHTVKLPMDRGEGQNLITAPGNIYSKPFKINIDPSQNRVIDVELTEINPPIPQPEDTKYIKHIKMQSDLLTEFWGRPMFLGAHILLPEGFEQHPEARYPICVFHGHFPRDFGGFRTEPPDEDLDPDYSDRFGISGYNLIQQQEAYDFYKTWISAKYPRMIIIEIQHANPYYDDSYAVNSASIGPYGDAITYELIPYIEEQFRGIGEGWARFLYGGSTGGWEALAAQLFYPDEYNGCFAACPDPIDFRAYELINIYEDKNAYYYEGPLSKLIRPAHRNYLGQISTSVMSENHLELVLGTNTRSGGQWDIWEAVFSPMGADGYPDPIWDKMTGEINPEVAEYWKENYDLRYIMDRDWETLGPKLEGKIHIYCGDMDNYYLNNAVYLTEEFLEGTTGPYYNGEVDYGDRAEHCWNGDQTRPNYLSRLRYNVMYVPRILKRIEDGSPEGADLTSWRY